MMSLARESSQFHVLAVDDSVIDRKLIECLLKTYSYQVTVVDSGSKALEYLGLNDHEIDTNNIDHRHHHDHHDNVLEVNLIITDYCMPGMTGYDLLRKIKMSESLKDIPVVIMSSENEQSRINMCLEEGAEEFFLKPVQLSDVNKLRPHLLKGIIAKETQIQIPMIENPEKQEKIENNQSIERIRSKIYEDLEMVHLQVETS